ncbi:MAG: acyl-CoA dehydrogenase family protein [Thermodesulfobacteriota bacterium]
MSEWLFEEEHRIFRSQAEKWVLSELRPKAEQWEAQGEFPLEVFRRAGELGFLAGGFPEEYGGAGGDFRYHAVLAEALAKSGSGGVGAGIGLHAFVALPALSRFGSHEHKERYLVPGLKGEAIGAYAVTEPDAGSDVLGIRTNAVRSGDHWVINGSKTFITNGVRADFYVVACKTAPELGHKGMSQILVEKGTPGFRVSRKLEKLGWRTSDTAELVLEDVRVPLENLLGEEGRGFYQIMEGFQTERLVMAVSSVAAAQECLEITMQYARQRQAFGQPIGSFQVIRHRFAEMLTRLEAARQLVYHTIWLYVRGRECRKEVAMCKILACETAVDVADQCIQIHGGYGYMMEFPVQRIWRDLRIQPIGGGTSEIQREIISRLLGF